MTDAERELERAEFEYEMAKRRADIQPTLLGCLAHALDKQNEILERIAKALESNRRPLEYVGKSF